MSVCAWLCVHVYVCVSVCVCERERERTKAMNLHIKYSENKLSKTTAYTQ